MSFIAILGAGAIGGALAQRLAAGDRTGEVRLIDPDGGIARGKALDLLQASPVDGFGTRLTGSDALESAVGASVIVVADAAHGNAEHTGEAALAMMRRLSEIEGRAPFIFAGALQRQLMARIVSELHVPPRRVIGSSPGALEAAVRALTALEYDGSGVEVCVRVLGVPPHAAVIAWDRATASGEPVASLIPAHRLTAISDRLPGLWPPGPLALAAAAARAADAVVNGSRRLLTCFVALTDAPHRGAIAAMPARLGRDGIELVQQPALTRQEQTRLENSLAVS